MATKTLKDLFLDEVRDAYDGEKQLIKALPKLAKGATSDDLRDAFTSHLEETRTHVIRLENIFEMLSERVRGKRCAGLAGIIEEGSEALEDNFDPETMDAAIITFAQRAEHYEMAAYGTLIDWAKRLNLSNAVKLLQQTLAEEKAADKKLSTLAEAGINAAAVGGSENGPDETNARRAPRSGKTMHAGARR